MTNIFILAAYLIFLIKNMHAHNSEESPTVAQGDALKKKLFVSGDLIFEDNFETLDSTKWRDDGNNLAHINEFQLYTKNKENSYIDNGILNIKPTFYNEIKETEDLNLDAKFYKDKFHPIRSARISTKESFSFTYGVLEVKARVPTGDWLFPAIWLMPCNAPYGNWPMSGEIDVMESRGNKNLTDSGGNLVGVQQVSGALHWGPTKSLDKWRLTYFTKNDDASFGSGFHVYKLVWSPQTLSFYIDNEEINVVTPPDGGFWEMGKFNKEVDNPWINGTKLAPFDKQFHVIINLAVGGTAFFSDTYTNENGKPWNNTSPDPGTDFWNGREQWLPTWNLPSDDSHFLIDYVRVWAL